MAKTEAAYPMNSGDHPYSYAHNSSFQKGAAEGAKNKISRAIAEHLELDPRPSRPFCVADFGCSIGPNTFTAVENIVESVETKRRSHHPQSSREFHAFFCDHVGNDFNTLFRTLPPGRRYLAAGVPGSFHGRVLPAASLDLAHSAFAVHWLSRVPKPVEDRDSPAFNGGNIHCIGTDRREVTAAYWVQFCADIGGFLSARAAELVSGGLMMIVSPCLANEPAIHLQTGTGIVFEALGDCLKDMVAEGSISEERVESFNIPMYFPSKDEFRAAIEQNEDFDMEKMEDLPNLTSESYASSHDGPSKFASMLRAVMEALLKDHFGDGLDADDLFRRYANKLADHYPVVCEQIFKRMGVFILLKRK